MKTVRLNEQRQPELVEVPLPTIIRPNDVLIRMAHASICGYDMMVIKGDYATEPDRRVGHEGSGVVEAVGVAVPQEFIAPGDRVTIEAYQRCGVCQACRGGQPEYCINPGSGSTNLMSEYVVYDYKQVYRLPDSLSLKEGSLIEPLMMAMHTYSKARLGVGKSLLIIGGGAMGLILLKLATLYPFSRIVVAEPNEEKRKLALRFGASDVIDPSKSHIVASVTEISHGMGFDTVIEASGNRECAKLALHLVSRGGALIYFALYGMQYALEVNLFQLYWRDSTISAVCVPANAFPAAIEIAPRVKLEEVITGLFPFTEAPLAFAEKAKGQHAKVMLAF